MKNITAMNIILSAMVVAHVCFGMDGVDEWRVFQEPFALGKLKVFYGQKNGFDTCWAEFLEEGQTKPIQLNDFKPLQEGSRSISIKNMMSLQCGNKQKNIVFQGWECFYESSQLQFAARVDVGDDYICFYPEFGSIQLYESKNIEKIKKQIEQNCTFFVKFREKGTYHVLNISKTTDIWHRSPWITCDGWWPQLRLISMPCYLDQATTKATPVIEIDLDEDKKAEPQHRLNKNITKLAMYVSILGMIYLFRDNIKSIFSAIFYGSPKPPRVFARDYNNYHSNYGVMPK